MAGFLGLGFASRVQAASIATDQMDYGYGSTAYFTGTGFAAGETVQVQVLHLDGTPNTAPDHEPWQVVADENGNFLTEWCVCQPDNVGSTLQVTATGLSSALTASASFTDGAVPTDFRQYSNGQGGNGPGEWLNGILQKSNSRYIEGMSVPQRIFLADIPAGNNVHTLTFKVLAVKGGNMAYDFLTSWDQAQIGPDVTIYVGASQLMSNLLPAQCGAAIGPKVTTAICNSLHSGTNWMNVPITGDVFGNQVAVKMANGTIVSNQVGQAISQYDVLTAQGHSAKVYGDRPIEGATFQFVNYDYGSKLGGDVYANYSCTWTSASTVILIEVAGHLAQTVARPGQEALAYPVTGGSSQINGGPYHFKLELFDGASLGNQDNQIAGGEILAFPPVCVRATATPTAVCPPDTASICADIVGAAPPFTYTWYSPENNYTNSYTSSSTNTCITVSQGGTYYLSITDSQGLVSQGDCFASLTVWTNVTAVGPDSTNLCPNAAVTLGTVASGTGPLTYQWTKNGDPISGATDSSLTLTDVAGSSAGTYCVVVAGRCNSVTNCAVLGVDLTPPEITCVSSKTVECGTAWTFDLPTSPDGVISILSTVTNTLCGGTLVATRTWVATDSCGNTSQCSQTVTVQDTTRPVFTSLPLNKTNECASASPLAFDTPTASDTCGGVNLTVVNTVTNLTCGNTFVATRTWQAADDCGNTTNISQTIATIDTTRPAFTSLPLNKTNECGSALTFDLPTASDTCGSVNVSVLGTVTNATCGGTFVATRTWQAVDACGNTTNISQTIATFDTTRPVFTSLPLNKTNECGTPIDFEPPTASDTCDGVTLSVLSTVTNLTCGNTFVATRTWQAADGCGNTTNISQTIATLDTTRPTFVTMPLNKTNECASASPLAFDTPTGTDICGSVNVTLVGTVTNLTCGNTFVATRTWSLVDACGNTTNISQTIATIDTTRPAFTSLPLNKTNECASTSPLAFDTPTASDTCGSVNVTLVNTVTNLTCGNTFVATRTWQAVDACGNTTNISQTIATQDTIRPVFTFLPFNKTNECGSAIAFDPPTATDSCGSVNVTVLGTVTNATCGGTFVATRTWQAMDACGNTTNISQTIATQDTTRPVFTFLPFNKTNECGSAIAFDPPTATDSCGSANVTVVSTVTNLTCGNTFVATRTWQAADGCGNTTNISQTIATLDTTRPTFVTMPLNKTNECASTSPLAFDTPTGTDICGSVNVTLVGTVTNLTCGNTFVATRTWSLVDACGNTTNISQTIATTDTARPAFTSLPLNKTNECASTSPLAFDTPTASDTCGSVNVTLVNTVTNLTCGNTFVATRTWQAVDACGNTTNISQTIATKDTARPAFTSLPLNKTNECGSAIAFDPPTATDSCGSANVTVLGTVTNLTCGNTFVATRTWQAVDACGNTTNISQTIATKDTTRPVFTFLPLNQTNECASTSPLAFEPPSATDICGSANVTVVSTVTNLTCGNTFVATRTWQAVDACGNTATISQTIATVDTTRPVFTSLPLNQTNECASTAPLAFEPPTASDTCGSVNVTVAGTVTNLTCGNTFVATRTWQATDACGNTTNISQTIATTDTTRPVFTSLPVNKTNECASTSPLAFDPPTGTDTCGSVNVTVVDTVTNLTCGNTFVATRTWSLVDACGNWTNCSQTIATIDTTRPAFTSLPLNKTNECASASPLGFDTPTASDTCGSANVAVVDTVTNLTCGNTFVATRTWQAADACGNTTNISQTIATVDTKAPTATWPGDKLVYCADPVFDVPTDVVDQCGSARIISTNDYPVMYDGLLRAVYRRCWTITDDCGNSVTKCQDITIEPCEAEHCSLTQGAYGNAKGKFNGTNRVALIASLLTGSDGKDNPVMLGVWGIRSLWIGGGDIPMLLKRLPAGGPAASLPAFSPADQWLTTAPLPLDNKGVKIRNVLLGQAITLNLNCRLDPTLPFLPLTNYSGGNVICTLGALPGPDGIIGNTDDWRDVKGGTKSFMVPPRVIQALKADPNLPGGVTVQGLIELVNRYLAGLSIGNVTADDLNSAASAINEGFDECRWTTRCPQ